jgi:hypothetical protein
MPAITNIAVTASISASASEVALLVASFTSNSPQTRRHSLGMTHRALLGPEDAVIAFHSEYPKTNIRL